VEAPGVEPRRDGDGFEQSRAVTTVSAGEGTRETVERNELAGVLMAHAIDRDELVARLRAAADHLANEPELAGAVLLAAEMLDGQHGR